MSQGQDISRPTGFHRATLPTTSYKCCANHVELAARSEQHSKCISFSKTSRSLSNPAAYKLFGLKDECIYDNLEKNYISICLTVSIFNKFFFLGIMVNTFYLNRYRLVGSSFRFLNIHAYVHICICINMFIIKVDREYSNYTCIITT